MTRKRYIQDPQTLELIEITADPAPNRLAGDAALWGDRGYEGMRAPDGSDISSRTKHRAYMQATGMTTADDYSGSWSRAKESRERYMQQGGSVSRADIAQSISKLYK